MFLRRLTRANNLQEARQLQRDLIDVLAMNGFVLNYSFVYVAALLEEIPEERREM